ncbi:hypothetical protein KAI04_01910 [Candidatus Pacearchaeota archaeon]|nr:hypothetical protein [Candidatus Pacearchaeota archaeon]
MKLLGFNFTKIQVERFKERVEGLKIGTRIDVSDIIEAKAGILKTKDDILSIKFIYGLDYEPGMAKLDLEGNLLISLESKKVKEILREWKDKKMPDDFKIALFNLILRKSTLKALQLEEEMNLPIHIQLPSLKIGDKK